MQLHTIVLLQIIYVAHIHNHIILQKGYCYMKIEVEYDYIFFSDWDVGDSYVKHNLRNF